MRRPFNSNNLKASLGRRIDRWLGYHLRQGLHPNFLRCSLSNTVIPNCAIFCACRLSTMATVKNHSYTQQLSSTQSLLGTCPACASEMYPSRKLHLRYRVHEPNVRRHHPLPTNTRHLEAQHAHEEKAQHPCHIPSRWLVRVSPKMIAGRFCKLTRHTVYVLRV